MIVENQIIMVEDSDNQLVERVKQGDQKAFELLVYKYERKIERLVSRMVRDSDMVADIIQETFIRAYRALPDFRGEAQFYTWLYRIAVNTAKKNLLEIKRDPVIRESFNNGAQEDETFSLEERLIDIETPETALAAKEISEAVNSAIEALPDELKQSITLREIEGLSYEEIADVMNCPVGTVRSRIFRAREAIAKKLRPYLSNANGSRW